MDRSRAIRGLASAGTSPAAAGPRLLGITGGRGVVSPGEDAEAQVDALISASLAGDQEAFGRLVELKRSLVFRTAYQHLGRAEAAREVAQTVFIRLWRNLHRFDRGRRFDTWLYRLTANAAIDHHRRERVRPSQAGFEDLFETHPDPAGRDGPSSHRRLELAEVQRILTELAELLTDKQRQAFLLRELEGLSTAEVAEVLEATESTVRNHVFQARRILREALAERYPEYVPSSRVEEDGGQP